MNTSSNLSPFTLLPKFMVFKRLNLQDSKRPLDALVLASFLCARFKKELAKNGTDTLVTYINGVKITPSSITILTGNPLINAELRLFRERLIETVHQAAISLKNPALTSKKLTFR